MSLSVLEALSILQPMEPNLAWFDLPAYAGDDETKSKKLLPKWLDGLASLLAGSSAGSRKNQVCAVSLSLSQSGCDLTIAFNWTLPHTEDDARKLINIIWDWLKDVSAVPEDAQKCSELLATILEVSLDRIRRRFKEKGRFVLEMIQKILEDEANLTEPQRNFLHQAALLHDDLYKMLGPTVRKPDFRMAAIAFQFRIRDYKSALSQLDDLDWLPSFKSEKLEPGTRQPALDRYMDKLQKPYDQYVLIWQVARKSFIRDALAVPLNVKVLASPSPESAAKKFAFEPTDKFETRVRSYLWAALLSYSPNSADDSCAQIAIDSFCDEIKESLDNEGLLPPLGVAHCECTLLCHHLDFHLRDKASSTLMPYPYIGVSKPPCFQCALYFQAYEACKLGPSFRTRGSYAEVFPCEIPTCHYSQEDEAIRNMMGIKLEKFVGQLVSVARDWQRKLRSIRLDPVPAFPRFVDPGGGVYGDDETKSKKLLPKWLDGLASLLAGSSSRKNQVCAVSLSLSQPGCDLTIAFNWTLPHTEDDARKLINIIWDWLKDVSAVPEDAQKCSELLATILEVSLDRIRRRFKEKGRFVLEMIQKPAFHCPPHRPMSITHRRRRRRPPTAAHPLRRTPHAAVHPPVLPPAPPATCAPALPTARLPALFVVRPSARLRCAARCPPPTAHRSPPTAHCQRARWGAPLQKKKN
ncbi:hypothetical protein GGX14DRAFT_663967 [Mycena pura]|uniref:Uncharacterized protein n=1 Tax=Mycena pura TaxID=153505 RepID=A0AAD7E0B4_9AGAR|nr:hypothetical protein GGX14DRAFT_663967 [Mycena pura]